MKLLLAELHRMQFGRKPEKVARQIEQLELRLEELQSNRSEQGQEKEEPSSPASAEFCHHPRLPILGILVSAQRHFLSRYNKEAYCEP